MFSFDFLRSFFFNPSSFWHWPYLVSGFVFVMASLMVFQRKSWQESARLFFDRRTWLTRSTAVDLILSLLHDLVWIGLILWLTTPLTRSMQLQLEELSVAWFGYRNGIQIPVAIEAVAITAITMVAFDFGSYLAHRLMHRFEWLWHFHAVHHSAEQLSFLTIHRLHPMDTVLMNVARAVSVSFAWVVFYTLFQKGAGVIQVWGVGIGTFFYMFTINLHHCHIPIVYPRWLRAFAISPHIHQLHHSRDRRHHDKNFGVMFSFWDRMFGTYLDERYELGDLHFGIENDLYRQSVWRLYLLPFALIARSLWARAGRGPGPYASAASSAPAGPAGSAGAIEISEKERAS
jgi:sterol desaturase/sphingolipid hydroxylase (fatty acid hydroxylase superfamily)